MKIVQVFYLFIFLSFPLFSNDDKPVTGSGEIKFYVDYAAFKGKDSSKTYQEFYFMLYADQLNIIEKNDGNVCEFNVQINIEDENGNEKLNKSWVTEAVIVQDSSDVKSLAIYDQWGENFIPGDYKINVKINDENSTKIGEAQFSLTIPEMNLSNFFSSQIEFISRVEKDSGQSHFKKSEYMVVPNPSRRYGLLNPILYLYFELYNIPGNNGENLTINYSISDNSGNTVKNFPQMKVGKDNSTISLIHGLNVVNVKSGIYDLNVFISDSLSEKSTTISRKFEVIQLDYANKSPVMSEEQAEESGYLIKYIATPDQYSIYENLTLTGKAQFLINFWRNLDPTPGTLENEYLENIRQRFNYAEENFDWGEIEGWKTDRGRILIKYGMPEEIERHYSEANLLSYEVWSYQEERGFSFVFGDLRSDGRFVLLHSTKEGEVFNPNWKEYLH